MKKGPLIITAALALTVGGVLAPAAALAQRPNEGAVGGRAPASGRPAGSQQSFAHHHPFVARPFVRPFVRPFFPFAVVAVAPAVVYSPPVYYAPLAYYAPPVYYAPLAYSAPPPVSYAPAPTYSSPGNGTVSAAPSPTPSVVEFSTGRYELRGDGVSAPYTWVWVPNPPTSPPPAAPTAPPSGDPRSSSKQTPARVGHLY